MASTIINIDTRSIDDWESFHDVFAEVMGFPDFYGRNMNAWIDCMTSLDTHGDGMTSVHVPKGDVLVFGLEHVDDFVVRCPDIYDALIDCAAFVNYRCIERGCEPLLALSFSRNHQTTSLET